ncbi:hypothetical protein Tco_1041589 [Tanacetum coccineum]|uniref:Uncharacterized protein n=1 Tax=Tanacetum coccineum TaxID=301880 RepID=A0ABQ5GHP8_9ASTR
MPEREGGGRTDSITGPNLQTQHPAKRFVVLSDSPCHSSSNATDAEVSSVIRSLVPDPPIMTAAIATTVMANISSISAPRTGEEPVRVSIFVDSTSAGMVEPDIAGLSQPAGTMLSLCSTDYEQLFAEFNVGAARQTCLGVEVRMQLEYKLRGRKKFEGNCAMQANLLKERDAEVASLKAQLSLKEAKVAKAIHLRGQTAIVEAAEAAWVTELASLTAQIGKLTQYFSELGLFCDELSVKASTLVAERDRLVCQVSSLEGTCFGLCDEVMGHKLFKEQIKAFQDEKVRVLSEKVSLEYLAALGGAIGHAIDKGMQDGLAAGIDHGKGERGLADVASYNPSTKANYISVVNALRAVDFPFLAQLESHKDASIADIIGLLHLEGPAAETPEAS